MKKFSFILFLFFLGSCNLLDQKSPNDIAADDLFTTATGAENALIGLYNSMQARDYYGGYYQLFPDAYIGIATTGGYDVTSLDEFGTQKLTPQNLYLESVYIAMYRTIANANRLLEGIEKIPDSDFSDDRKSRIMAEARFVRAMAHFDLMRWFGYYWDNGSPNGIALVDHVTTIDEIIPRSKVSDCYGFILNELNAIQSTFPDEEERNPNYFNRSAVDALLARVYLFKGDHAKAYAAADAVLRRPEYALMTGSGAADFYTQRGTSESVFELGFDIRNQSAFNGLTYGKDVALRPELFFLAAQSLQDFFAGRNNDIRSTLLDFENNDESIMPDGRTQKYRGETIRDNPAYILRTAEIFLIRAEAGRKASLGSPLDDLNAVRTARGADAVNDADIVTDEAFTTVLLDEILAEFNFEGHYLFNVVRLGQFEAISGLEAYKAVFPIPNREVAATSGAVAQNPGY